MGFLSDAVDVVMGRKNVKKGGPTLYDIDRGNYDAEKGQWKKGFEPPKPAEEMDAENIERPMTLGEVHKLGKGKSFNKGVGK